MKGNRIIWAESWTEEQIKKTREGSRKEAENRTKVKKKGLLDRFIITYSGDRGLEFVNEETSKQTYTK